MKRSLVSDSPSVFYTSQKYTRQFQELYETNKYSLGKAKRHL